MLGQNFARSEFIPEFASRHAFGRQHKRIHAKAFTVELLNREFHLENTGPFDPISFHHPLHRIRPPLFAFRIGPCQRSPSVKISDGKHA